MSASFASGLVLALLLVAGLVLLVRRYTSFLAQEPGDYADQGPAFDIREKLNGPLLCEGVVFGPMGRVTSRFFAEFEASWTGDSGRMRETFHYDSGVVQHREWQLEVTGDGMIRARAEDVVGTGRGRQRGNSVLLRYRLRLPEAAGGHVLDTTDWMYLTPNGHIMNRSQFRKFGIKVAELVATMRPRDAAGDTGQDGTA